MIRRSHRGFDKSSARSVRIREKAAQLRNRVKQSTQMFMERHRARLAWWSRSFRVPVLANWFVGQFRAMWAALLAMVGLSPRTQTHSRHTSDARRSILRNRMVLEGLEQRQLMAADITGMTSSVFYSDAPGAAQDTAGVYSTSSVDLSGTKLSSEDVFLDVNGDNVADYSLTGDVTTSWSISNVSISNGMNVRASTVSSFSSVDDSLLVRLSNPGAAAISAVGNATEGSFPGVFDVYLPSGSAPVQDLTLTYSISNTSSASATLDFTALPGTVVIPAGSTVASISVTALDDNVLESTETLQITLTGSSSPSHTIGVPASAQILLFDTDSAVIRASVGDGSVSEVGDNSGFFILSVTDSLTNPLSFGDGLDATVTFSIGGSATSGSDFTAITTTAIIPAGSSTIQIPVSAINDTSNFEANETIELTLTGVTTSHPSVTYSNAPATITIVDPVRPIAKITSAATTVSEGGNAVFNVSLVNLSNTPTTSVSNVTVTLGYGGSASASDYNAPSTVVVVPAGQSIVPVTVGIVDDNFVEGAETVSVSITAVSGIVASNPAAASVTINANDASTLTVTGSTVLEGGSGNLTFTVNTPAEVARVFHFARSSTSSAETNDYTFAATSVTIPASSTQATVVVNALTDSFVEGTENLLVTLTSQTSGPATTLSTALGTLEITDGNSATYNVSSGTFSEGATNGLFTISLSAPAEQTLTFTYGIGGGNAVAGVDYSGPVTGTVLIAPSATSATVSVPLTDDNTIEANETFGFSITAVSGTPGTVTAGTASATMTIDDNDTATLSILAPVATLSESNAPAVENLLLVMTNPSSEPVTVTLGLGGTASVGSDYTIPSMTVTIPANQQLLSIPVTLVGGTVVEANEDIVISVAGASSAVQPTSTFIPGSAATMTIVDDDSATVQIAGSTTVPESGAATLAVTMSAQSQSPTTIFYSTQTGTATAPDFTGATSSIIIAPSVTTGEIVIPITTDSLVEDDESFTVSLTSVSGGGSLSVGTTSIGTVTIDDDDTATLSVVNPVLTISEGGAAQVITLSLSNESSSATVYNYSLNFGTPSTATGADVDSSLTGTVSFSVGQTLGYITLSANNDTLVEATETFTVDLVKASGDADIGPASITSAAAVTILDNDSTTANLLVSSNSINEGTGANSTHTFTIALSTPAEVDTVFNLTRQNGPTSNVNFTTDVTGVSNTIVTIAAGDTTATIPFVVIADSIDEANERFRMNLTAGVNSASVAVGTLAVQTVEIVDDDNAVVTINGSTSVTEGGVANLTISSTASQQPVTVTYQTVSGTAGTLDYASTTSSVVTLSSSTAGTSVVISINTSSDNLVESNETFSVSLIAVDGATSYSPTLGSTTSASITILDDDSVTLNVAPPVAAVTESAGASTTFTIALSGPAEQDVTVVYSTSDGTALSGSDYTSVSSSAVISAGSTSVPVVVTILDNNTIESQESFSLSLGSVTSNLANLVVGTSIAEATIADNDSATASILPIIDAVETTIGAFGNSGGFLVSLTNPADAPVTITYGISGSASNTDDYATIASSVVVPTGQTTAVIVINPANDLLVEGDETVELSLSAATGAPSVAVSSTPATVTIVDNDSSTLTISGANTSESTGPAVFTFSLSQPSATATTVTYSLGGSATNGNDYTGSGTTGVVTFAPSATVQTLSLAMVDDSVVEGTETISVSVTSISGAVSGTGASATIAISDNDAAQVNIIQLTPSISENGGNAQYLVYLNSLAQYDMTATVSLSGTASATSDYNAASSVVVIPAGSFSTNFSVPLVNDTTVESTETLIATVSNPTGSGSFSVGSAPTATISILNDDTATVSVAGNTTVSESVGNATVQVSLSAPSDTPTVVSYTLTPGTASSDDFGVSVGTVSFAASQTVALATISIANDNIVELNESFTVSLTSISAGNTAAISLGSVSGNVTISANDSASVSIGTVAAVTEGTGTGGTATIPLFLSAPSSQIVTVTYSTVAGSATTSDYTSASSVTVTFAANSTSTNIFVPITGDSIVEADETFSVSLGAVSSSAASISLGTTSSAAVTITDDDVSDVYLFNSNVSVTEGGTATFVLGQSLVASTPTVISYSFVPGSAVAGDVLSTTAAPLSGVVTIPAGSTTAAFSIVTNNDNIVELQESFTIALTKVSGNDDVNLVVSAGTVTINDNDSALLRVYTNNLTPSNTLTEGNSVGDQFILTLQNPSSTDTTVSFTVGGTASAGSDYNSFGTTAVIPQGSTVWPIAVTLTDDNIVENAETIILSLQLASSNPAINAIGGFNDVATNTIVNDDGTAAVTVSSSVASITEGNSATFSVSLSKPVAAPVTITYNVVGSSSLTTTDYSGITLGTGLTTVVSASAQLATIGFSTFDDSLLESDESISLVVTGVSSSVTSVATGSPASASVVINDNDTADLAIVGLINGNEAGPVNGLFRIQMTKPADTATTVSYTIAPSSTASDGVDFSGVTGTATISAGSQFVDVPVTVLPDTTVEGTESLALKLVSRIGDPQISIVPNFNDEASIVILDDDSATISVQSSSLTVSETSPSAVVTLTMTNPAVVPVQVAFTVTDVDTTAGSDYVVPTTLTASFAPSATIATVTVTLNNDAIVEDTESFNVSLTSVTSGPAIIGSNAQTGVSITDNDNNVAVTVSGLGAVNEGQGLVYQVSLAKVADEDTTIHFSVGGGTAGASDFTAPTTTSVVVLEGQSVATVTVATVDDSVVEGDETLSVTLTSVSGALASSFTLGAGASASETIVDGDAMTATVTAITPNASEGLTPVVGVFEISISGASDKQRTVHYSFSGDAIPADYTAPASVVFGAGTSVAQVTITPVNDAINENAETVVLSLTSVSTNSDSSLSLATLSSPATVTIADDDLPFVSVALSTVSITEGGAAVVNFTLDKPANEAFTLTYTLGGTSSLTDDYLSVLPATNSVTFAIGDTLATATIATADDSVVEGVETLTISLGSISGATTLPAALGTPTTATLTIADNDQAFVTVVKTSDGQDTAVGPVANGVFWINLTAPSQTATVISYSIGGTASASADYAALTGLVTIPAGQTDAFITVATVDDTIVESNETVIMTLNSITSGNSAIQLTTSNQSATITIVDSDVASISVGTPVSSVAEGASANFRISLSQPVDAPTTVTLTNLPAGTATAGTDYTGLGSSTVVTIPAMSTSVDVAISASNDTLAEGNETVLVNLSGTPSFAGRVSVGASNSATLTINDTDSLMVEGVVINNGAVQRSRLTSISVDLNGVVNSGQESLFEVRHRGNNTLVPPANMSFAYDYSANPGKTRVNITFTGSGANVQFGSLADGNYDLTVKGTLVNAASQTLGADYVFGNQSSHGFYRFFGDLNGNRFIDFSDLAVFGQSYQKSIGDPNFRKEFDSNDNNTIDFADLAAFGARYNTALIFA